MALQHFLYGIDPCWVFQRTFGVCHCPYGWRCGLQRLALVNILLEISFMNALADSMSGSSSWKDYSRWSLQSSASSLSLTGPKPVSLVQRLSFQLCCESMLNILQANFWMDQRKSCLLQGTSSVETYKIEQSMS